MRIGCGDARAAGDERLPPARRPAARDRASSPESIRAGNRCQTLLGATGTGKTATMAWVMEALQRPALVIAHNKTLAAQLCNEFREFFPENAVEYFVSYYDYYQPEAYVPQADLYIEKDSSQNDDIARLRLAATSALLTRRDVIVVASVSCIYGLGSPEEWRERVLILDVGTEHDRDAVLAQARREPVRAQRHRARTRPVPGQGRRAGGAARERRDRLPHLVLRRRGRADLALRPAHRRGARAAREPRDLARDRVRHLAARRSSAPSTTSAPSSRPRCGSSRSEGKMLEAHRIRQRTEYDLEMLKELGFCSGIENYSRVLEGRPPGLAPVHPDRLLPRRLRRLRRRVAPDDPADRRHVRGRPLAQADARRLRVPAALRDGQPAAALRRVPREGPADGLRLGDARRVRAAGLGRSSRSS